MSDRYLYKAKRTDNREWVIGILIIFEGIAYIMEDKNTYLRAYYDGGNCVDFDMRAYKVDPSTICQCTGLKGKNGKLIWENDIIAGLRYKDWGQGGEYVPDKCVVIWDPKRSAFSPFYWWDSNRDLKNYEIIGSTIDNPELLEAGE